MDGDGSTGNYNILHFYLNSINTILTGIKLDTLL